MQHDDLTIHHRVCYADTDAGGVVYHARYIEFAELARNRLMYQAGFSFASLMKEHQVQLMVHKVNAVYHAPAMLEDDITLRTAIGDCRPSRSVWVTEARRGDELLAVISLDMIAWNTGTRQLTRHPEAFLQALESYRAEPAAALAKA